ncbi:MAG: S41 family peptidase, partial [Planctomycetota bacterium]
DPYTSYFPPVEAEQFDNTIDGVFVGIGVTIQRAAEDPPPPVHVVSVIPGGPAQAAGVLPGDRFLEVDGTDVRTDDIATLQSRIKGPLGTEVVVKLQHPDGEIVDLTITRARVNTPTVQGYDLNDDGTWDDWIDKDARIGFLGVTQFTDSTANVFGERLSALLSEDLSGLIIDLRQNGGGTLDSARQILDMFLPQGAVLYSQDGAAVARSSAIAVEVPIVPAELPVAVLIDGATASASELVAGALRDHRRAFLVGTRSFGKGSVQVTAALANGGRLKMTHAYYYLPSGKLVHRRPDDTEWGVDPDIEVVLTHEQIIELRRDPAPGDPQSDAALDALRVMLALPENRPGD